MQINTIYAVCPSPEVRGPPARGNPQIHQQVTQCAGTCQPLGRPAARSQSVMPMRPTLATICLALALPVLADTYTARVVGVTDGDTIKALDGTRFQHRIRLAGIDAPEKTQPYGQRSKQHLAELVFGREVTLDCGKQDRYKREVCVVLLDGQDINLLQVKAGCAWWYRQYAREQTPAQRKEYEEAERTAQELHAGLWRDISQIPPWEWRKHRLK